MQVENARRFSGVDRWAQPDIRENTRCPLILIKRGKVRCAVTKAERRDLLLCYSEKTDLLLMAWPGEWRTDVFVVTEADLDAQRKESGMDAFNRHLRETNEAT